MNLFVELCKVKWVFVLVNQFSHNVLLKRKAEARNLQMSPNIF